jgi:hypothetical protein
MPATDIINKINIIAIIIGNNTKIHERVLYPLVHKYCISHVQKIIIIACITVEPSEAD